MRYVDSLLTEGEQIILRTRQHWLALFSRARTAFLLWLIGVALLVGIVWFSVAPGVVRDVISGIAIVLLVLGLLIFTFRAWQWWAQDYVITNRRLLKVTGILNKRSGDSSLEKINDAILSQSVWGRMLNFGNLEILTAADQAVDRYYMLNSPKEFKKVMLTQKHNLETEFVYGRQPSPPFRATENQQQPMQQPPMQPQSPPQPVPAPAAPPPPAPIENADHNPAPMSPTVGQDESLEVTQTLSRLADLRDQGAISAEEYEQKKDELLGRL